MSFVVPGQQLAQINAAIDDPKRAKELWDLSLALELRDHNTFPEGSGPVRGWGGGGRASRGRR